MPGRGQARRDEPFDVHIEFVVMDGEQCRHLARRQAAIMREVLQWLYDNPPTTGTDATDHTAR